MIDFESLPYPVASLYKEMLDERVPVYRFRALIRAFAGLLKFITLVTISDYVASEHSDSPIDELLAGDIFKRPSLGHWNAFLREILKYHSIHGRAPRIDGLFEFYFKSSGSAPARSKNVHYIDELIKLRNEYVHPDIWPTQGTAQRLYERHIEHLDKLYSAASFLAKISFTFQKDGLRRDCRGANIGGFKLLEPHPHERDGFYVEAPGQPPLYFYAFLIFDDPAAKTSGEVESAAADIVLFEGLGPKRAKYLRGNRLVYDEHDAFNQCRAILESLKERLGQTEDAIHEQFRLNNVENPDWRTFFAYCARRSTRLLDQHERAKKYDKRFYFNRPGIEEKIDAFVASTQSICLLVGDSGSGKTNLLCHLTDRFVGRRRHCVLHFSGRTYDGEPLLALIAGHFVKAEGDLVPYLRALTGAPEVASGGRFVVFFDAINEYHDAPELFRRIVELDRIFQFAGIGMHKFVVSMRTGTFERYRDRGFDISRERFFFTKNEGEANESARIVIGPFSAAETRKVYEIYALNNDGHGPPRKEKEAYGIRLGTPFEMLPAGIRRLAANPIFLRTLVMTYDFIDCEKTLANVLLSFYEKNIPEEHRYFICYFLDALWFKRQDVLTEDDLINVPPEAPPAIRLAFAKVKDYFDEDPVSALRNMYYVCTSPKREHSDELCDPLELRKIEIGEDNHPFCPVCGNAVTKAGLRGEPVRSTLLFLQDEGIISVDAQANELPRLRFTYDRFFEIMMARHLMAIIARHKELAQPLSRRLRHWFDELAETPVYDDVFVHLLALLHRNRIVEPKADADLSVAGMEKSSGVLYDLEVGSVNLYFEGLLLELAVDGDPRVTSLVREGLVRAGMEAHGSEDIGRIVGKFSRMTRGGKLSESSRLTLAHLSLRVATELELYEPFLAIARHPSSAFRAFAVSQAYFLWKRSPVQGQNLLVHVEQRLYWPLAVPKPRLFEFFLGLCFLILLRHPRERGLLSPILGLLQKALRKMSRWVKLIAWVVPPMAEKILRDVPSDYNPATLGELRAGKEDINRKPLLKKALLEYLSMLREGRIDVRRQQEIVRIFQEQSPNNDACYLTHQLMQALHMHCDPREAMLSELRISREADRRHKLWIQGPMYTVLWMASRQEGRIEPFIYEQMRALWKSGVEDREFYFEALVPNSRYHNWSIYYFAVTIVDQKENAHPEEVLWLYRQLLASGDRTLIEQGLDPGLHAFFRSIEIVGAELSSLYPNALRLVQATIPDLLNSGLGVPEPYLERLAITLQRMRVLYYEEVGVILDEIHDRKVRSRLKQMMSLIPLRESIGALMGVGGQDFYLYAVTDPYWRNILADMLEPVVTARSLGGFIANAVVILHRELGKAKAAETVIA